MHNSIPGFMRAGFRFGWSGAGRLLGRMLARHGRAERPSLRWDRTGGPWFGNQLMTLTLRGRSALLGMDRARTAEAGVRLTPVLERTLSSASETSHTGG